MNTWQQIFRTAVVPLLSVAELAALERGLVADDPALIHNGTTVPPPLQCHREDRCRGACLLGYGLWRGRGLVTVDAVEESWSAICWQIDQAAGYTAANEVISAWDEQPRTEVRRQALREVRRALRLKECAI